MSVHPLNYCAIRLDKIKRMGCGLRRVWQLLTLGITAALLNACVEAPSLRQIPSMLDTHGTGAAIIEREWWFLFWLGSAVFLLIVVLLAAILIRHFQSRRDREVAQKSAGESRWIWLGGIALPLLILLVTFPTTVRDSWALSAPPNPERVTVNITGHRWWWEVHYPEHGFRTANQLYIPVGQSVRVNLSSEDVIHSFWAPQLHFKRDLVPGKANSTWIQADEAGVYRGICAEFCGKQHARMMFMVIALEPEEYQAAIENERRPAIEATDALARRGQEVFLTSQCVYCHTIRGTPAAGETGPDLTHLASRLTIAAGALENNTGNLGGWILDPQHIKPGNAMPPSPLNGEQLQALLAYLNTLQ